MPITSSPGRNPRDRSADRLDGSRDVPPRTPSLSFRNPGMRRTKYGSPVMRCHTSGPQPAACTRTSTSSSPTDGVLDVPELQHVGGAVPVLHDRLHGSSSARSSSGSELCVRRTLLRDPTCTAYTCQGPGDCAGEEGEVGRREIETGTQAPDPADPGPDPARRRRARRPGRASSRSACARSPRSSTSSRWRSTGTWRTRTRCSTP